MQFKILGKTLGSDPGPEPSPTRSHHQGVGLDKLRTLIQFFPIGKKLRYFPEFKTEVVFDTVVIAYCLDGDFVYSGDAVEVDAQGLPVAFRVGEGEERRPLARISRFQILVPDTTDLEMHLDYQRRALIGRGRQFNKGNYISLIANAGAQGVSTVDTEVAKQVLLPDGPYAHTQMVLLDPEFHTLSVTDQRRKARAKTSTPVSLALPEGKLSGPGTIIDMSEDAVRIRLRDTDAQNAALRLGAELLLDFHLGESEHHYRIKGLVIRRSAETCVVQLKGLFREGRLEHFSQLDLLELKSGLLNFGH